ncbi:glycosyltransferase WbuB [Enterovibrio norvegicus FF-454]|uniref:Glycosyltransferase WbuB n=1 Tax=Enterovibrio norvegicus FF-454 TaxID=1185651 RepID=A0A1E5C6E3_9GAMM|nr:glycosyltransferase family 4 protein [Enterovibrio norvegicus]OEE61111.1 glycosyltransferase WbuB [Enterovibrio norvegicus FF-454]
MKRVKVLVLAEYIGENHNSTAYYWSQIVKQLKKTFDVVLITPDTNHSRIFAEKYDVTTRYVQFAVHNKNSLISRLLGQLKQTSRFLRSVRKDIDQVDLVFTGTNPILTMFALAAMRRFRTSFKWLVLVHDVFPNNLVPAKVLRHSSYPYRLLTFFSKKVYATPDKMICIGRDMKVLLEDKTGKSDEIEFIPNWASTTTILPQLKSENSVISDLGWQNKVVFQFFGNMGRLQGVPNLLKAIALTEHKSSRFIFIGCGSESKQVVRSAEFVNKQVGYERINYFGNLDLEKNNIGLNACDVSLVSLSSEMFGLGVPSKAYFSMAADKPILYIGDTGSELEVLLSEHKLGWHCVSDDAEQLASLLDSVASELSDNPESTDVNPRNVMERHFSEQMALDAIQRVAEETIKS